MKLSLLVKDTYLFENPSTIGLYRKGHEGILIDTGNDDSSAKKVLDILKEEEISLTHILITHGHADHMGGAAYLQRHTGAKVFGPAGELFQLVNPLHEPRDLFGTYPPKLFRTKTLLAKGIAHPLPLQGQLPAGFSLLSLPGHSLDHCGIISPDGVLFVGDALLPSYALRKYQFIFGDHLAALRTSLEKIGDFTGQVVLGHGGYWPDHKTLVQENLNQLDRLDNLLWALLEEPRSLEDLHEAFAESLEIKENWMTYALNEKAILMHLGHGIEEKRIQVEVMKNKRVFKRSSS